MAMKKVYTADSPAIAWHFRNVSEHFRNISDVFRVFSDIFRLLRMFVFFFFVVLGSGAVLKDFWQKV